MALKPKIQALIDFANETTKAGDVLLGDAVKTLADGYNGGANVPSAPLVIPSGEMSAKLAALLAYSNEVTGAGDTRMGDAIKTLCEGYGGGEPIEPGTMTFYPSAFSAEFSTIASSAITGIDNPIGKGVENGIIGTSTNANWRSPTRASGYTKCTYLFDCSAIPRGAHITGVSCRWQGRQGASRTGSFYTSLTISGVERSDPSAIPYRSGTASIGINTMANIAALTREDLDAIGISCFTMNTSTQTQTIYLYGAELTISYE